MKYPDIRIRWQTDASLLEAISRRGKICKERTIPQCMHGPHQDKARCSQHSTCPNPTWEHHQQMPLAWHREAVKPWRQLIIHDSARPIRLKPDSQWYTHQRRAQISKPDRPSGFLPCYTLSEASPSYSDTSTTWTSSITFSRLPFLYLRGPRGAGCKQNGRFTMNVTVSSSSRKISPPGRLWPKILVLLGWSLGCDSDRRKKLGNIQGAQLVRSLDCDNGYEEQNYDCHNQHVALLSSFRSDVAKGWVCKLGQMILCAGIPFCSPSPYVLPVPKPIFMS